MKLFFILSVLASFSTANARVAECHSNLLPQDTAKVVKRLNIKKMDKDMTIVPDTFKEQKSSNAGKEATDTKKAVQRSDKKSATGESKSAINNVANYPGGERALREFVRKNTRYPEECKNERLTGRAIVKVTIMPDGSQSGAIIDKSSGNKYMDAEALRVVSLMPRWVPAKNIKNGKERTAIIAVNFRPGR